MDVVRNVLDTEVNALATRGRSVRSRKIANFLSLSFEDVETASPHSWSLLNQAAAALVNERLHETNIPNRIAKLIDEWHFGAEPAVYRADECVSFRFDGYEEPAYFCGFANPVKPVFSLIDNASVPLDELPQASWVTSLVGAVVDTGPAAEQHVSSTQRNLPGTIISQQFDNADQATETLVHEGGHTAFNLILEGLDLSDSLIKSPATYYSPWKKTSRPAFGLLHAMFSFGQVELVRRALTGKSVDDEINLEYLAAAQTSVQEIVHDLRSPELEGLFDALVAELKLG